MSNSIKMSRRVSDEFAREFLKIYREVTKELTMVSDVNSIPELNFDKMMYIKGLNNEINIITNTSVNNYDDFKQYEYIEIKTNYLKIVNYCLLHKGINLKNVSDCIYYNYKIVVENKI